MRLRGPARPARSQRDDEGFGLVEVIVAMTVLSVVVAASGYAMLSGLGSAVTLRHKQTAAQVAVWATQVLQAVDPQLDSSGCSNLLQGRTQAAVTTAWNAATASGIDLSASDPTWAPTTCPAGPVVIPLQGVATTAGSAPEDPVTRGGVAYTVRTFIGSCVVVASTGCVATHAAPSGATTAAYLATVVVTWTDRSCPSTGCMTTSSTIIDPALDPVFNARSVAAPVATPDTACILSGVPTAVDVVANDTGSLGSSPVQVVTSPAHGTLADISSGTGAYTSVGGYVGTDTFTYRLADVNGTLSNTATVTVTVASSC